MKKTRMPQRLLALVLVLMMLISVLPVSAMAAELTPADAQTGLTATDVTNELTDSRPSVHLRGEHGPQQGVQVRCPRR